jgi:ABC-type phosphate/phosphonate transport system substrate-binding protein
VAERLLTGGVTHVPRSLTRDLDYRAMWRHPGLLLGQACEYPMSKSFREYLRPVARPRYRAVGCDASSYRSVIVTRATDPAQSLAEMRNCRCVINEPDSNSGMNLFRAAIAPIAGGTRYFRSVHYSGSHRHSLELVVAEEADITAIDCVTWAHLERGQPLLTARAKVVGWTPASPCLPFVTSHLTSETTIQALRRVLAEVFADEALRQSLDLLLLTGAETETNATFDRVLGLERDARQWRYATLQ